MQRSERWASVAAMLGLAAGSTLGAAPRPEELADAKVWMNAHLLSSDAKSLPFSFTFAGRPAAEIIAGCRREASSEKLDAARTEHTLRFTHSESGLQLRVVAVVYESYPVLEWTLYFRNGGSVDSEILEQVQPLDVSFDRGEGGEFVLHHNVGSPCQANDYQPLKTELPPGASKRLAGAGGRPSSIDLPYFNLQWAGRGAIIAVGWPGQWAAEFTRDNESAVRLRAGQELTRLRLHPGEEIRTPLIALQFYRGDVVRAQNVWRRWMIAHNLPRPGGKPLPTQYGACFGNMLPRAEEELAVIDGFLREGIRLDHWILDAGWYPNRGSWMNTGTWEVDRERFPRGLREISDRCHQNGMQFVVWFEPERVTPGSWIAEHHPEWVLSNKGAGHWGNIPGDLLDLGNPQAWKWLVDHIESLLAREGIDVYRQDFNIEPLSYWRATDAPDRQGITEIRHVTGYLAFWDELLRRRPGLWIDSCASGGRRNDLETLRRAVPLLRSDFFTDPASQQAQTVGISSWIPYYGSGLGTSDAYWFRSCIFPASRVGWDTRKPDLDYPLLDRMLAEYRRVEPYLLGDFYPLTPSSLDNTRWIGWQFDRPESGAGCVQAFRRPDCDEDNLRLRLQGLDAAARYAVTNLETGEQVRFDGQTLMEPGLLVTLPTRPAAAVFTYQRLPESAN